MIERQLDTMVSLDEDGMVSFDDSADVESPPTGSPEPLTEPTIDVDAVLGAVPESTFGFGDVAAGGRGRKSKLGGHVPIEKADLFTTDGVGQVMADALDGFFRWCGAPPMEEGAHKTSRRLFAYYLQIRAPDNAGQYQPEILVGMHLLAQVVPRLPQITEKTGPWYRRAWTWLRSKTSDKHATD